MRFTMMFRSVDHKVIPEDMMKSISNIARAHGFEITSVIPESLLGEKFLGFMDAALLARERRLGKGDIENAMQRVSNETEIQGAVSTQTSTGDGSVE